MKAPIYMSEGVRQQMNAEHWRVCWSWYTKGALSVTEALRAGLEGETDAPSIADLIKFCEMIENKAKEAAP